MGSALSRVLKGAGVERSGDPLSMDQWINYFSFNGISYPFGASSGNQTLGQASNEIEKTFAGYANGLYRANGIVFSCIGARHRLFTEARFQFRRLKNGRPGDLFGTPALAPLETPWPNGTTGDLLGRAIQDVDICGNFFAVRPGRLAHPSTGRIVDAGKNRLTRLRPDWMTVIAGSQDGSPELAEVVGYAYTPGGVLSGNDPIFYGVEQVGHWTPTPDPMANWLGISWLSPVLTEIMADNSAMTHKLKFFQNGATSNMMVTFDPTVKQEQFDRWISKFNQRHEGILNAYKCLHPSTDVALWNGQRCPAGEIQPGDLVVAWSDGKPVPGVVSAAEVQPSSPIVTVTTERGRIIKTNDQHPFLTRDGWVKAADLNPGSVLTTGLGWGRPRLQDSLSVDDAWLLGLLTGDGCLVGSSPTVAVSNAATLSRLAALVSITKTNNPRSPYDYRVAGIMEKVRAAGLSGKRSWEKRVPQQIMTGGTEVVGAFLSGLIDSDGHVSDPATRSSAEIGLTSTSLELLRDTQHLLASLGINASVSAPASMTVGAKGGGSGATRRHDAYRLCVFGNIQARMLNAILVLSNDEKAGRLATYGVLYSGQDRSRFDRVASVVVSAPEKTVGLEIADYHTHVTGGVVTHNTLFLGGGADAKIIGSDMKQIDFAAVQGHGETRIASAAGVPPIIVGLSEGLAAATYSNYGQARRAFADGTMRPLWRGFCSAMGTVIDAPQGNGASELWYDDRDIAFLREDEKDAAEIANVEAGTIHLLITAGFTADSVIHAVMSDDWSILEHTGMFSVQLMPAGTVNEGKGSTVTGTSVPNNPASNGKTGQSGSNTGNTNSTNDAGRAVRALLASKN